MTEERPLPHPPRLSSTSEELALSLEPVVLATPGVAGLVPSMATALGRLRLHRGPGGAPRLFADPDPTSRAGDGISVDLQGDAVTVVLDVTVDSSASVLDTALAVRSAAVAVLVVAHPGRYTVKVNVLGRDPDPVTGT